MTQAVQTPEQHRYLVRLLGFEYSIQYRPGRENGVADALSRVNEEDTQASLYLLSIPQFAFLADLKKELVTLPEALALLEKLQKEPTLAPDYKFENGLIIHRRSLWDS